MWEVVDEGEDDFDFTSEAPPEEELTEGEQAVRNLVQSMEDVKLTREACVTLGALVRDKGEVGCDVLLDGGGLVAIIDAMAFHDRDPQVQLDGCGTIANMAYYYPDCGASLCSAGAARAVIDAMVRHKSDPNVVSYTAGVLWNLTNGGAEACETVCADGGVPALIQSMGLYFGKVEVMENISGALRNLSFVPSAQAKILESKGISVILNGLLSQSEDGEGVAVVGDLCSILENVTVGDGASGYEQAALMESALKLMVKQIEMYRDDSSVISGAIGTLWSIVCASGVIPEACKIEQILESGATEAIILGMTAHKTNNEIQAKGCSVLACIANTDTIMDEKAPACEAIIAGGGLECLADAMEALKDEASQLLEVVSLLGLIGFEVITCHERLIKSGSLKGLLSVTKIHLDDAFLVAESCATLEGLADGDTMSCTQLVEQGAVKLLIEAMKHHLGNEDVAANTCGALWNLAFGSKHCSEVMVNEGAMQAIIACMRVHAASATVITKACGAMWNAANGYLAACDAIIRAGGTKDIQMAIEAHPGDQNVVENATGILQHLQMR